MSRPNLKLSVNVGVLLFYGEQLVKILHVVAGNLSGGAARSALWLHQNLLDLGVDSTLLVQNAPGIGKNVTVADRIKKLKSKIKLSSKFDLELVRLYRKRVKVTFSPGFFGVDITKLDEYKEADIVHFHWINNGFISINTFSKIDKPIVWTFRDMWPFTGGCHYDNNCGKYANGCGNCPILKSNLPLDLSLLTFNKKKKHFKDNIYPVAVSKWIKEEAFKGYLFKNRKIKVIYNGVDTSLFKPIDKSMAREILDLPLDKKIVLFGAINSEKDRRKGFNEIKEALNIIDKSNNGEYFFAMFGNPSGNSNFNFENIKSKSFGYINNDTMLKLLYSAADVFVSPSLQEAFGKTVLESMACGTPVVAFNSSSLNEAITHGKNGYLSKPFSSDDLARGIIWILEDNDRRQVLSEKAKIEIKSRFEIKLIAQQYKNLYEKVL